MAAIASQKPRNRPRAPRHATAPPTDTPRLPRAPQLLERVETHTVKIQRPLYTTDPDTPWLIYGEDMIHAEHWPEKHMPPHVIAAMEQDHKGYFNASWSAMLGWVIGQRVVNEHW